MKKTKPEKETLKSTIKVNRNRSGAKKRVDLFANLRNTEHPLDNIFPIESSQIQEIVRDESKLEPHGSTNQTGLTNLTSLTTPPSLTELASSTSLTIPTGPTKNSDQPISPIKDFAKVPNSLTRIILAQGLFRGKSKQIYDYLWSVSRGAINPQRVVRRTQKQIQKGAGIGSLNTIKDGLKHLETINLIKKTSAVGEAMGNEYEIYTAEEIGLTGLTGLSNLTKPTQNPVELVKPKYGPTGLTQTIEIKGTSEEAKTFFKDNKTNDDEAFADFIKILQTASEEITGKKLSKHDRGNLEKLAHLLVLELKIAASRTDNISSVPAFLTEILRRKLRNLPTSKDPKTKIDTVGKSETGKYEIKPLNEQEREAALIQLQDFASDDLLQDFKKWYTAEDWKWLTEQIKHDPEISNEVN